MDGGQGTGASAEFTVVLTAQSRIYFEPGQCLLLAPGDKSVRVYSHYQQSPGWSEPAPVHLVIEVRGASTDLRSALESFANIGLGIVPSLALATNCHVGPTELELGYDSTPERPEREFFQRSIPRPALVGIPGRRAIPERIGPVFQALGNLRDPAGRQNAAAHYVEALGHWRGGQESLALAHLYMGVEAITNVVLARHLSATSLDEKALANLWGIPKEGDWRGKLRAETRRRLVFNSDDEAYRTARKASDGFEHGFLALEDVRGHARTALVATAAHLRRAMLESLDLPSDLLQVLLGPPADTPRGGIAIDRYLWGTLSVPPGASLAPKDEHYPHFEWTYSIEEIGRTDEGTFGWKPEEKYTARLGDGVVCGKIRIEVWDPRPMTR